MENEICRARKLIVAENLKRLIRENGNIRTVQNFAKFHGSDIRTVKRWRKSGVDSISTIEEIAKTLGASPFELIMTRDEYLSWNAQKKPD